MSAASQPVQRRPDAKLLVVDASGAIRHAFRSAFTEFLHPRDLVIANDAAHLTLMMCASSPRSYSVQATFIRVRKTGQLRRPWRQGID